MKTRDAILQKSLDLFNDHGVAPISTNHIAAELKISPGNLYYHFKNKEEIIRVIVQQMLEENFGLWKTNEAGEVTNNPLQYIDAYQNIYWKYRFFFRELAPVLRKDPQLAKIWRSSLKRMMELIRTGYQSWVKQGLMTEIKNPQELELLAETVLVVSTAFLSYFETKESASTKKKLRTSLPHLVQILKPHCTQSFYSEMIQYMEKFIANRTVPAIP